HRDPLTGLYNRRHLDAQLLDNVVNRKADSNLCLLLIDIDLFKRINDEFGHQAGDQVLARLAGLLTSHCRSSDIICRYGGEELVVLMPEVTIGAAVERADAIRLAFTGLTMRFNNRDLAPTLSVGIAACPLHATSGDRLFECADQALYRAKAAGRNRTVLWSADRLSRTDASTICAWAASVGVQQLFEFTVVQAGQLGFLRIAEQLAGHLEESSLFLFQVVQDLVPEFSRSGQPARAGHLDLVQLLQQLIHLVVFGNGVAAQVHPIVVRHQRDIEVSLLGGFVRQQFVFESLVTLAA